MLEFLRNGVRTWYFKVLLGVLVLSFAIWGVGNIFRPGLSGGTLIKVGNIEIGGQQFASVFQRQMQSLARSLGGNFTVDQARRLGVPERVVNGLVVDALYNSEAESLGIAVGDSVLANRIRSEPGFRNQQGEFDRGVFEQSLAVNGFSEEQFVARLHEEISRAQLVGSLTRDVPASRQLADRLYRWREGKRIADFITIPNDEFADVGTPDDAALQAYYKENERSFTAPEYRSALYVLLTSADVEGEIDIPEDDIKTLYDQRLETYREPERRTVQQMIFSTEDAAKAGAAQLAEGKEFVAVARDLLKQDENATNILGDVAKERLPDALADPVFALSVDQVSPPLKGPFGWYLFRVTAVKPPFTRPLTEVRDELRTELVRERSANVLYELSNDFEDALGGGASMEEAANQVGVSAKKVAMVDRRGHGADEKPIADLPQGQEFLTTLFETPEGEDSELVDMGINGYLFLRTTAVTPSQVRPLDSVRTRAIQAWQSAERRKRTEDKAKSAVERVNKGEALSAVAADLSLQVDTSPPFNREGEGAEQNLPRGLAAEMFDLKVGNGASAPSGSGFAVAVLKEVKPVTSAADRTAVDALGQNLAQRIASDLEVQYNNALRQLHPVEVDRHAIDTLLLQF